MLKLLREFINQLGLQCVTLSQLSNLKISTESQRYLLNSEHRKILLSFKSLVKVKLPENIEVWKEM